MVVTKVWVEADCISCGLCEEICPKVFFVQEETCIVRFEAGDPEFTALQTDAIMAAAEACPVGVIRFETAERECHACAADKEVTRRGVISAAGVGWVALGGAAALSSLAAGRFMFPNALEEPDPKTRLGDRRRYAEMPVGTVDTAFAAQRIWIVRLSQRLVALDTTCTHLGCLTSWVADERKFRCPCHGSVFLPDGTNVEGPAPRALDRLKIWVEDGVVIVDRSRRFQLEKNEWDDPDSFVAV